MTDLLPVTLEDQIAEVDRELALRRKVYPRWVSSKAEARTKLTGT